MTGNVLAYCCPVTKAESIVTFQIKRIIVSECDLEYQVNDEILVNKIILQEDCMKTYCPCSTDMA